MTSATFRTEATGVPRFDAGALATVYGSSAPTFQMLTFAYELRVPSDSPLPRILRI